MFEFWFGGTKKVSSDVSDSSFVIDPTVFREHKQTTPSKSLSRAIKPPPLRRKTSNVILAPCDTDDEEEEELEEKPQVSSSRPSSTPVMSPSPDSRRSILSVFDEFHPIPRPTISRKLFAPPSESSFCTSLANESSAFSPQLSLSDSVHLQPRCNLISAPLDSDDEEEPVHRVTVRQHRQSSTRRTKRTSSELYNELDYDEMMKYNTNKRVMLHEAHQRKRKFLDSLRMDEKPGLGEEMMQQFSLQHKQYTKSLHDLNAEIRDDILAAKAKLGSALKKHCVRQEDILRNYEKHQEKLRKEAEARAKALEAKRQMQARAEAERKKKAEEKRVAEAKAKARDDAKKKGAIKRWKTRIAFMKEARQKSDTFYAKHKVPALKIRGAIGRVVNQISATQNQIQKCVGQLKKILGTAVDENIAYIAVTMVDRIISSCGKKISLNQDLAYCYGYVLYGISADNGFIAKLILCSLSDRCPFVIPWFPRLSQASSPLEFLDFMRRKEITDKEDSHSTIENKMWETEEMYFERMRGFMGIFAGYIDVCQPNHMRPHEGKKFLNRVCRVLRTYPKFPSSIAPALGPILQVAGFSLQQRYPQEFATFAKLLKENIAKYPKDTSLRMQHVRELMMEMEKIEKGLKEPEGRKIHTDIQVREQDIQWQGH